MKDITMQIRGLQITAGTIIKYVENIMYVKNFREMTIDTTKGSWIVTADDLLDLVQRIASKGKVEIKQNTGKGD